jgi:hypothetical protein
MVFEKFLYYVNCLNPTFFEKVFIEKKGSENLVEGIKNVFFASFVPAIVVGILMIVIGLFFSAFFVSLFSTLPSSSSGSSNGFFGLSFGLFFVILGIISTISTIVLSPISFLLSQGITWVISKVLGGKGTFTNQSFYASFFAAGYLVIYPVMIIPCVGSVLGIIFGFLLLYLQYLVVRNVHQLDSLRSAVVVISPIAFFLILYALLWVVLLGFSGGSSTASYPSY